MARVSQPAEINSFVAGIVTEASPLTFPDNASVDEQNFILNKDGSRQRRLGMDFESGFTLRTFTGAATNHATSAYTWENAGNIADFVIQVVQEGRKLQFFSGDSLPISGNYLGQLVLPSTVDVTQPVQFAVVDGRLVVASGIPQIYVVEWDGAIITRTDRIEVRDTFGVEDPNELDLGTNVIERPSTLTRAHKYNLRNGTYAVPRLGGATRKLEIDGINYRTELSDPISAFNIVNNDEFGESVFPSYSDNLNAFLYPDANIENNRTGERFHMIDQYINPLGTVTAPNGRFIIDLLDRGSSRTSELNKLYAEYPLLQFDDNDMPTDQTSGGAKCIAEYAGRVWYGGFDGSLNGGDAKSPILTSYIAFSKLVTTPQEIFECHQVADPTSSTDPDLVATDGGILRIDGAYGIRRLVDIGNALLVIASNGVWQVQGGSGYGFTATDYLVTKITEHGTDYPQSVVVVDSSILYWGDDGIYLIAYSEVGDLTAQNLSATTIQRLYDDIDKIGVFGFYDSYDRKVRWLYNNRLLNPDDEPTELIFDLNLQAFSISQLKGHVHRPLCMVKIPPYRLTSVAEDVTVDDDTVTVNGEDVTISSIARIPATRETGYVIFNDISGGNVQYSFGIYQRRDFMDFGLEDAKAYMVTGYISGGDFQRYKQVPYITFYLRKTEDGFTSDEVGDLWPSHPSGCLVQSQWNWTNSANSNKWGRQIQVYRFRRHYIPEDLDDEFEDGNSVVTTKNKLRGRGRVLSLLIESEEEKDCQLLGWSMILSMSGNV